MEKKGIIKTIFSFVRKSVFDKSGGKVSSSRISAYSILSAILSMTLIFIVIELVNAIVVWSTGLPYIIPYEHIVIFGMILTHHLTLLGINKNAETKVEQSVQEKLKSLNKKDDDDQKKGDASDSEGYLEEDPDC